MKFTLYTDYSLRVLIFLRINEQQLSTITQISEHLQLSRNHIVKIVSNLSKLGLVKTIRGNGGGLQLNAQVAEYKIGSLIQALEPDHQMVQCVNAKNKQCAVLPHCKLSAILDTAQRHFFEELDQYSLNDIIKLNAPISSILSR